MVAPVVESTVRLGLTDAEVIAGNFPAHIRAKFFLNRSLPEGTEVAVRLNLTGEVRKEGISYALQSVHEGKSARGRVIGYDTAVMLREAVFCVSQKDRAKIAAGANKYPMAAVAGKIAFSEPKLEGIEIRFNPKTTHLFVRCDDGRAVRRAEEVTVFNTRVYARGEITYWTEEEAPSPQEGLPSEALFAGDVAGSSARN